jgi:hypothetical protein
MYEKDENIGELLGQQEVPEMEQAEGVAPIQMDQATFMQILQMMMQAQQTQMQPPGPPQGMPQGGPPMPPQGPDPRIAQALMQGGM